MTKRHIAHITIEADTPLKVGSAASDFLHDSPIQRDWNGLPMILGTSIAGVLRKDFEGNDDDVFGKEDGSKVIFSNALLLDENNQVQESLVLNKTPFMSLFDNLPIREHTAITDKGVAKKHSKFDEEVVYSGSRFRFSMEMLEDERSFTALLELMKSPSFRLGGGSTKGFGRFKIIAVDTMVVDTVEEAVNYSSSLNAMKSQITSFQQTQTQRHDNYTITLKPDDFFMFGSGFGDEDADQIPVTERMIDYDKKGLSDKYILIPATSLKGALAHRATYHYNKKQKLYVGNDEARQHLAELFGEAKNSKKALAGSKGKVLFSDVYNKDRNEHKVFDHVSIDRFTGGGIDGALFQEKTSAQEDTWNIEILLEKNIDSAYVEAFEEALNDLCTGMLPLGGATTKGHGVFTGTWSKI